MKYINSTETIRLQHLIVSGEISDETIIDLFDKNGKQVTRGKWYEDNILNYSRSFGKAYKAGTGLTIKFVID